MTRSFQSLGKILSTRANREKKKKKEYTRDDYSSGRKELHCSHGVGHSLGVHGCCEESCCNTKEWKEAYEKFNSTKKGDWMASRIKVNCPKCHSFLKCDCFNHRFETSWGYVSFMCENKKCQCNRW